MDKNNYENIPQEMRNTDRWIVFQKVEYEGKTKKIPINPDSGRKINGLLPSNWLKFCDAVEKSVENDSIGIGYVLGDGISGIDLDNVVENGKVSEEAQEIIATMNSYTEYSISGRGIHIYYKGTLPNNYHKRKGNIELYSEDRFFVVSGNIVQGRSTLEDRQENAMMIYKKYIGHEEIPSIAATVGRLPTPFSDEEVWKIASSAKNGEELLQLCVSRDGEDRSSVDMRIACKIAFYTDNPIQIERIMREYTNRYRKKWDDHPTYLSSTIKKAVEELAPSRRKKEFHKEVVGHEEMCVDTQTKNMNGVKNYFKDNNVYEASALYSICSEKYHTDKDNLQKSRFGNTGFKEWDRLSGGIRSGLYILAGTPSIGKTTFTLQLVNQVAAQGNKIFYVALEQSEAELIAKSLTWEYASTHLNKIENLNDDPIFSYTNILDGDLNDIEMNAINSWKEKGKNIQFYEASYQKTTAQEIAIHIANYMEATGSKPLVIVDYLQLVCCAENTYTDKQMVDSIIREFKKIQKEYKIPIIAICSVNRDSYYRSLDIQSLKESGGLEYSADVIYTLEPQIFSEYNYCKLSNIEEKRKMACVDEEQSPRKIVLRCLKNRFGARQYSCNFIYYQKLELFLEDGHSDLRQTKILSNKNSTKPANKDNFATMI